MKAVPFINTMLNIQYRVYILETFYHELIEEKFDKWKMKDMVGWHKFVNYDTNITIEFYGHGNPYKIKNPDQVNGSVLTLPYPNSVDDFICDCQRSSVPLYWNQTVIDSSENRIHFMDQKEIKNNITELLTKIEKS